VYEAQDSEGRTLRITVAFNNGNRGLTSATVHRDAGCVYARIYMGTGTDGTPDSTPRTFPVTVGDTEFSAGQLSGVGLDTIEDILALQITAGP
jgi:hypothetical protein